MTTWHAPPCYDSQTHMTECALAQLSDQGQRSERAMNIIRRIAGKLDPDVAVMDGEVQQLRDALRWAVVRLREHGDKEGANYIAGFVADKGARRVRSE